MRRGMPRNPAKCSVSNVKWKPMTNSQKLQESETRIEQTAQSFRVPIVKTGEDAKKECSDERVVKVSDNEIGICQLPVKGHHGQHHAGQARNQKLKEKSDAEKHGQFEANLAAVHCADPVKNLDSCWYGNQKGGNSEEGITD